MSASKKLGEKYILQLAFSRTILRPSLDTFTPFSVAKNSYTYQEGAVNIQPETTNRFSSGLFSNFKFGSIGVELSYSRNKSMIRDFYEKQNDVLVITAANIDLNQGLTLNISGQIRISSKLYFSHSSNGNLIIQRSNGYNYRVFMGYLNDRLVYQLNKKHTLILGATCFSPNMELQGRSQEMDYLNTSLSYYLNIDANKNMPMSIGIIISNPWLPKGLPNYSYRSTETLRYHYSAVSPNPIVNLNLNISFTGKNYQQRFNRNRSIFNNDIKSNSN